VELAFCDFEVVQSGTLWLSLVDQEDHTEHLIAEIFLLDCLDCESKRVTKYLFRILRLLNRLLNLVTPAGFKSDSDSLLEHPLLEALLELSVNNSLHFRVNMNIFFLFRGNKHALSGIDVNALVHERVNILAVLSDVEMIARLECQAQRLVVEVHEVEYLACDAGSELSLGEVLVLDELLDAGDVFGDLVPLEVDDVVELFQSVNLLLDDAAVKHRDELR